jgi:uncharacterized protein YukE
VAGYEVDPMGIESIVDALRTATEGIQDDLDLLKRGFELLLTQWTGEAADAYRAAQTGWL